jgi:hypothetical protein
VSFACAGKIVVREGKVPMAGLAFPLSRISDRGIVAVGKEESYRLSDHLDSGLRILVPKSTHEVLLFAASELKTHLALAGYSCSMEEGEDGGGAIVLRVLDTADGNREEADGFRIFVENGGAVIVGGSPRAVLYGAYRFLEEHAGISWPTPAHRSVPVGEPAPVVGSRRYKPAFSRRGIVLESSETSEYAKALIDWSAKNGLNDLFFTIELWERFEEQLRPELARRQLKLTLGGHSLGRFFPAAELYPEHPEWFALAGEDGARMIDQPCYSCEAGVEVMVGNVVSFAERELEKGDALRTLSLWPNDNKHVCGCSACRGAGFMTAYIGFLDRLRKAFDAKGIKVNVEHIAYNAQLEWSMLEDVPTSSELDTLIACWGRNYRDSFEEPILPRDVRFKAAVDRWAEACGTFGTGLTAFEYYSDYWMLTALFPPLFRTIGEDMASFRRIGASGVMSLIVPYGKSVRIIREEISGQAVTAVDAGREMDSERAAMWPNLYVFARMAWEEEATETTIESLCRHLYGPYAEICRERLDRLSDALAGLTAYNTEFFKLRFTDTWLRTDGEEVFGWQPAKDDMAVPRARIAECRRALAILEAPFEAVVSSYHEPASPLSDELGRADLSNKPAAVSSSSIEFSADAVELTRYYDFVSIKLRSIYSQSSGQLCAIEQQWEEAAFHWREALERENLIDGWDRESCAEWLEAAMTHAR